MKKVYRSFTDAKQFVRSLGLKNNTEWRNYCKSGNKPEDITSTPNTIYKNKGWISLGDWLGTGRVSDNLKKYRSFEDAKKFVRSLELKSRTEWKRYCNSDNKPDDIPKVPWSTYKNEWTSLGDWLGTGRVATQNIQYRTFEDARNFVQSLGLKGRDDWEKYCVSDNKPDDIPRNANNTYKKEWKGMGNWLGTGRVSSQNKEFCTFEESKQFVQTLGLKSQKEWSNFCMSGNKPENIPTHPHDIYKNKGWVSLGHFLGTGRVATQNIQYRTFEDARNFVQSLGLKGRDDWEKYCVSDNKPDDIPSLPSGTYKKEWKGWGDWLDTGRVATQNIQYRSFEEAQKFVQKLGLKGYEDWKKYCKSGNKPDDIPAQPWKAYKKWNIERRKKNEKRV
jgi:hypothetical protein